MKTISNDTLREALEELWPTDADGVPVSENIFDAIVVSIESHSPGREKRIKDLVEEVENALIMLKPIDTLRGVYRGLRRAYRTYRDGTAEYIKGEFDGGEK